MKAGRRFDPEVAPGQDRRLLRELAEGEFIRAKRNVIFLGRSGTGKTHLVTAIGVETCRLGVSTRFVTGGALANELIETREARTVSRLLGRYSRVGLLADWT